MQLIDDSSVNASGADDIVVRRLLDGDPGNEPWCALTASFDSELAMQAMRELGVTAPAHRHLHRPMATVNGDTAHLVVFIVHEHDRPTPVHVFAATQGLLVISDPPHLAAIGEKLRQHHVTSVWPAVMQICTRITEHAQDVLDALADHSEHLENRSSGFTSASQRKAMADLRNHLFSIQELANGQCRMLAPDGELAQVLEPSDRRLLRRCAHAADSVRSRSTQLYARVGDVLQQQSTIISERLTLVATVFLPLNLMAGLFGMNFAWMIDRIDSMAAFVGLGVLLPLTLMLLTIVLTHRVARTS